MKRILGFGLLLLAITAVAGVIVTQHPGRYAVDGKEYDIPADCIAAAEVGLGADPRKCVQVNEIVIEGQCDPLTPPPVSYVKVFDPNPPKYANPEDQALPPGEIARDGGVEYTFVDQGTLHSDFCPGSTTEYCFTQDETVPAPYPDCSKVQQKLVIDGAHPPLTYCEANPKACTDKPPAPVDPPTQP